MDRLIYNLMYLYWGKAKPKDITGPCYHLLIYHCLDVAAVAQVIIKANCGLRRALVKLTGLEEEVAIAWLLFFTAIHDLGKFAEAFQGIQPSVFEKLKGRLPDEKKNYAVRHDSLGLLVWTTKLYQLAKEKNWLKLADEKNRALWMQGGGIELWVSAVTGHHGKPPSIIENAGPSSLYRHFVEEDVIAAAEFCHASSELFISEFTSIELDAKIFNKNIKRASWLLAGFGVLCDWIGSDNNVGKFEYVDRHMSLREYWENFALPRAQKAVYEAGILPLPINEKTGINCLFPEITEPSPLQAYVETCELGSLPQLFIIEDVTGSGKTEAALTLAHRLMAKNQADGLYVALPTMATANAMYERLEKSYLRLFHEKSRPSLILAHGARHLSKAFRDSIIELHYEKDVDYGPDESSAGAMCSAWIADNRKKALLADIGVGTVDQALLSILHSRHQSLRLSGLARKVLILDEIHAYDSYMSALIQTLLRFHSAMGGSAILLSATLPKRMRNDLINAYREGYGLLHTNLRGTAYPLITQQRVDQELPTEIPLDTRKDVVRRLNVRPIHNISDAQQTLIDAARSGKCACWIRNTVTDAIEAYQLLKPIFGEKIILFHARFAMGDRLEIEGVVLKRFGKTQESNRSLDRAGWVVIGTQVLQESLDLDFDEMVSDLTVIDLLIQRAGRLHRHARDIHGNLLPYGEQDRRGQPLLHVVTPPANDDPPDNWYKKMFPNASYVYPNHGQLWLTAKLLQEKGGWNLPDDARELIENVFGDDIEIPQHLIKRADEVEGKDSASRALAVSNALDVENGYRDYARMWVEDTLMPTRLGEASTTVRLARWDGGTLKPWIDDQEFTWDKSSLSVRANLISQEYMFSDPMLKTEVERIKESMPDKGKWSVLLILIERGPGVWEGKAIGRNDKEVGLRYCKDLGLRKA